MAGYDPYRDYPHRYVREERRDDRDARFAVHASRELVPRVRQDAIVALDDMPSDRGVGRARSAEPGYGHSHGRDDDDDDYDDDYRYDYRHRRQPSHARRGSRYDKRGLVSRQDKIIAAVAGAALLVGGKELYDRHEAKVDGTAVHRNALSSAALAGFGALAGYQGTQFYSTQQAHRDQKASYILHRARDGRFGEYYSDDDQDSREKRGHRNFLESAIAATGLGAAVKSLTGDARRGDSPAGANKIQKAAMASLLAGATEAFRVAKEPGGWKGEKTKRILTAAAGAATVDAAQSDGHGKLGLAESVIGGLVGNRLINGSKKDLEEDKATGRSRSRSRGGGGGGAGSGSGPTGLAALATAGLGALGTKKLLDRSRSPSRGRGYHSPSPSPEPRRQRSRSRSVVDKARSSLAKLGIGGTAQDSHRRGRDDVDDHASSRRPRRYSADMYDEDSRHGRSRGEAEPERSYRRRDSSRRRAGYGSDSDLGDSDSDEPRARKTRGKQV